MRVLALLALGACGGAEVAAPPPASTAPPPSATPEEYQAVQSFMGRKKPQVLFCYATAIENREIPETAHGRVKLTLAVLPSGSAADVRVAESTLKAKAVEDCIVGIVGKWAFPPPSQRLELTYTYELLRE